MIGVVVINYRIDQGLIKNLISNITFLQNYHYKICLVVNEKNENDNEIPREIKLIYNHQKIKNASANRKIGFKYLNSIESPSMTLFLDGDMVINNELSIFFETNKNFESKVITYNRVDISTKKKTIRNFNKPTIFGSFIIMNPKKFPDLFILSDDEEEQWLHVMIRFYKIKLDYIRIIGVIHYDKNSNIDRIKRILFGRRGVGFWQGLIETKNKIGWVNSLKFYPRSSELLIAILILFLAFFFSTYFLLAFIFFWRLSKRLYWLIKGLLIFCFERLFN